MSNMMHAEILVHIRAPSSTKDDQRYRSIAKGVMDFQPTNRISLAQIGVPSGDRGGPSFPALLQSEIISPALAVSSRRSSDFGEGHPDSARKSLKRKRSIVLYDIPGNRDRLPRASPCMKIVEQHYSSLSSLEDSIKFMLGPHTDAVHGHAVHTMREAVSRHCLPWQAIDALATNVPSPSQVAARRAEPMLITDFMTMLGQYQAIPKVPLLKEAICRVKSWDRGYWLLPIDILAEKATETTRYAKTARKKMQTKSWKSKNFIDFWDKLAAQIEADRLGPVSLYRTEPTHKPWAPTADASRVQVRLYCWAETLAYQYLALRWASVGMIDKIAAKWVGSDGKVIIEMPGKKCDTTYMTSC